MEIQSQNLDAENIEQVEVLDLGTKDLNVFFKSEGAKITKFEKNETTEAGGTNTYKITFDDGDQVTMTIKNGQNGEKGDTGAQGIQGEKGEQGIQGEQGQKGADGTNGADGFSPTASVTQTANGATISITDKNGTTQAAIANVTITPNADKSVTISNGTSSEKYLPQSEVAKWGIVSQTQTWSTEEVTFVRTYSMSKQQWGWIPKSFIDLVSEYFTFNATSGYFEFNNYLLDISYQEMVAIYATKGLLMSNYIKSQHRNNQTARTLYPIITLSGNSLYCNTAFYNSSLEYVMFTKEESKTAITISEQNSMFCSCKKLKRIDNCFSCGYVVANFSNSFLECYSLEHVMINMLNANISFSSSSLLDNESIAYMINNSNSSKTITITLHADAYARAMADADVQSALAAHTNVTLVSA